MDSTATTTSKTNNGIGGTIGNVLGGVGGLASLMGGFGPMMSMFGMGASALPAVGGATGLTNAMTNLPSVLPWSYNPK